MAGIEPAVTQNYLIMQSVFDAQSLNTFKLPEVVSHQHTTIGKHCGG